MACHPRLLLWKNGLSPPASPKETDHFSGPTKSPSKKISPVTISHYLYYVTVHLPVKNI